MLIQVLVIWMTIFKIGISDGIVSNRSGFLSQILFDSNRPTVLRSVGKKIVSKRTCQKCVCGVPGNYKRIVGGQRADVNKYPWMTMILYKNEFFCGGTVINDRYVLTAAHCAHNIPVKSVSLVFLTNSILGNKNVTRKAKKITIHRNYQPNEVINDIALIQLDKVINFSDNFRPVCLASGDKIYAGSTGIVTGWGAAREDGDSTVNLNEVNLPILSNTDCRKTTPIVNTNICAGYKAGQKDACQGDSGGPMHVTENGKYVQVGIVSWGDGCARPRNPGVYTRITSFYKWINYITRDACFCD